MSDLDLVALAAAGDDALAAAREIVEPELLGLAEGLQNDWLKQYGDYMEEITGEPAARLEDALEDARNFKVKAVIAADVETARDYAEGHETAMRRVRTLLLAEAVVASQEIASMVMAGLALALDVLIVVAKKLFGAALSAVSSGLIGGGGGAPVPAGGFPSV